jgi:regulator of sigma E protease
MFLTIIVFLIILGVLVFVHEFGHFIVAKKSGMQVEEFGFGFPPRIAGVQKLKGKWKWVWGHKQPLDAEKTVYSLNWIPLGGFVRILGENNEDETNPKSFINKGFWPRFFTLVAGVIMNWILAAVIFTIMLAVGTTSEIGPDMPAGAQISNRQVAIVDVLPNSPADKAGLKPQDFIISVDGQKFENYDALRAYIVANEGKTFNFTVKRISQVLTLPVQSLANPSSTEGPTGIELTDIGTVRLPILTSIKEGISQTYYTTITIVSQLGGLFKGGQALQQVGGPVRIAKLVGQVRLLGIVPLLNLTALLSLSLAILNILPFPALDGGRVLFLFIEKIRRKRNNQKVEQFINTAGFVFLLLLMVLVTVNDIIRK